LALSKKKGADWKYSRTLLDASCFAKDAAILRFTSRTPAYSEPPQPCAATSGFQSASVANNKQSKGPKPFLHDFIAVRNRSLRGLNLLLSIGHLQLRARNLLIKCGDIIVQRSNSFSLPVDRPKLLVDAFIKS
jgi:hypothetical protein